MAIEHSSAYPATTERRVHTGNLAVSDKQDFGYFGYLDSHSNVDICSMDSSRIVGSLRQVPRVQRFDVSRNGQEHALSTGPCTWIRCAAFTNDPIAVAVILRKKACNSANTACNLRRDNAFTADNPANHAICTTLQFDGTPFEQQKVYSFARSRKMADDWTGSVLHPSLVRVHSVKDQELCGKIALFFIRP